MFTESAWIGWGTDPREHVWPRLMIGKKDEKLSKIDKCPNIELSINFPVVRPVNGLIETI
ncbi:hypothetical protein OEG84_17030 [Hoeflea sp. G2-23]|uniref:Uncharacterized protein n=1 Tax=Hoeflea algicola TaxID=2983763 RepID=A0ABT3ZC33_9HYPH|nr:hypothetical protein [Hoeflea algicola]MCY0149367.1 hypothetical protein [Hoeflea algicola]